MRVAESRVTESAPSALPPVAPSYAGAAARVLRRPVVRAVGGLSRRLGRPELLAAVDGHARHAQLEHAAALAVLAGTLARDSTYVDVGANRGQLLADARRVAPLGHHVAFEPIPALAQQLARDFPGVDCRNTALGASGGVAEFCHFRDLDGWSGLRRSPDISDRRGAPQFIEVTVSTLDAELAGLRPRVVKVDVEGAEQAVLEGGRSVLAQARPLVLFEHVPRASALYGTSSASLWAFMAELGFEVFSITGDGPVSPEAVGRAKHATNWLARPV